MSLDEDVSLAESETCEGKMKGEDIVLAGPTRADIVGTNELAEDDGLMYRCKI